MTHKVLTIYLDENASHGEVPLYEAIVRKLVLLEVNGATVHTGIMGFGRHHKVHRKRLFGVSDDRPVLVSVVDKAETIERIIPLLKPLAAGALMVVTDCVVV